MTGATPDGAAPKPQRKPLRPARDIHTLPTLGATEPESHFTRAVAGELPQHEAVDPAAAPLARYREEELRKQIQGSTPATTTEPPPPAI